MEQASEGRYFGPSSTPSVREGIIAIYFLKAFVECRGLQRVLNEILEFPCRFQINDSDGAVAW